MATNDEIIHIEMEAIKADIINVYNTSGKRTTGEFENGLEVTYAPNSAILSGYLYLAGRAAGKQPPTAPIEKWLNAKGITPINNKISISSLAYLIARKIGKEGAKKESQLAIYDKVITPERIQSILDKITQMNVSLFVSEINIMIQKLVINK